MEYSGFVNGYCFTAHCSYSIFNINNCVAVWAPLDDFTLGKIHCKFCGSELIAKEVLDIKIQIHELLTDEQLNKLTVVRE